MKSSETWKYTDESLAYIPIKNGHPLPFFYQLM